MLQEYQQVNITEMFTGYLHYLSFMKITMQDITQINNQQTLINKTQCFH